MRAEKKKARRLVKHCQGCGKDLLRSEWDEHVLTIVRSLRQHA